MTVKDTVYSCLINYPTLYENKWQVYHHLFSSYGNGYDWVDGELVEMILAKKGKDEDGYPRRIKPTLYKLGIKRKEIPDRVKKEAEDFTPIFYSWFPYRLESDRRRFAKNFYEHYLLMSKTSDDASRFAHVLSMSKEEFVEKSAKATPKKQSILHDGKREMSVEEYLKRGQCFRFSYVYNYPNDIKPDWAVARQEWEDYLKSVNCFLNGDD